MKGLSGLKENKVALVVIDMENGFIMPGSPHRIAMAGQTLENCKRVIEHSRASSIPVIFVKRIYRQDGSDVELTRWAGWKEGGRSMAPASEGLNGADVPEEVRPQKGDYSIIKPRWSAFFQTELDLILRRLGVTAVAIIGTTTPNCIRTTAYDANSLDYEVIVVEDCCSSQTKEIQKANIDDMERMGAIIVDSNEYCSRDVKSLLKGWVEDIREDMETSGLYPEPFEKSPDGKAYWNDKW